MQKSVTAISELFELLGVKRSETQQHNDTRVGIVDVVMALIYSPDCSSKVCREARRRPLACATSTLHNELSQGRPACIRTRENSVVYTCDRRSPCNDEWLVVDIPVCTKTGCNSKVANVYTLPVGGVESNELPERQTFQPGCIRSLLRGPCDILPPGALKNKDRRRKSETPPPPSAKKTRMMCDSVPLFYNCEEEAISSSSENGTSEYSSSCSEDNVQARTPSPVRSSGSGSRMPLVGGYYAPPGVYGTLRPYLMR